MPVWIHLPNDGWVKLACVQVDEPKGDGYGELPRHAESHHHDVGVLSTRRRDDSHPTNSHFLCLFHRNGKRFKATSRPESHSFVTLYYLQGAVNKWPTHRAVYVEHARLSLFILFISGLLWHRWLFLSSCPHGSVARSYITCEHVVVLSKTHPTSCRIYASTNLLFELLDMKTLLY